MALLPTAKKSFKLMITKNLQFAVSAHITLWNAFGIPVRTAGS